MEMTDGQRPAVEELRQIANASKERLEILEIKNWPTNSEWIVVEVSIDCSSYGRKPGGLPLRQRERFFLFIPPDFPFEIPIVETNHTRFADFAHVQWKRHLCLYQAPATEWEPSDRILGFIDRLHLWLKKAALNELDPIGAPLHPPVAYITSNSAPMVIPRVDTPPVPQEGWVGLAHLKKVSDSRVDIVGWSKKIPSEKPDTVGAAILIAQEFPFEYPKNVRELINELESHGISRERLFITLQLAILENEENTPLFVVIGTPMRGIQGSGNRRQHLTAWYVDPVITKGLRLALHKYSKDSQIQQIGKEVEQIVIDWTKTAKVEWCRVREDRPEIVVQRDHSSALSWFKDRIVSLWGCGALGSHIAEYLIRVGVKKIILRDYGRVAPGLISRQLFNDADIGQLKVNALADRLKQIGAGPDNQIEAKVSNILKHLDGNMWSDNADIIIDTTASRSVVEKLELRRRTAEIDPVPIISMMIGHRAENGLVTLILPEHIGGTFDVIRRAKLAASNRFGMAEFLDEFWPSQERHDLFQPEPGCSDPTFVGSAADVAAMAGVMLNCAATQLKNDTSSTALAHFVSQPYIIQKSGKTKTSAQFSWQPDLKVEDPFAGYQVRIANAAWNEIRGWINRSRRVNGHQVETGGILFGQRDDVSKILWINEITGPPPDTEASEDYFLCGVEGIAETNQEKQDRTRGSVQFVGMWHTHPRALPLPSEIDVAGMKKIVCATDPPTPKALLLIVGSIDSTPSLGAFVYHRSDFVIGEETTEGEPICTIPFVQPNTHSRKVGLALSGGGSRAIAFHLGCLRALHDRNILDQIEVISSVSGGSVIAAMYAYSDCSFAEFENRVLSLLRDGLQSKIIRQTLFSHRLLESLVTIAISGSAALVADGLKLITSKIVRRIGRNHTRTQGWVKQIHPPLRRWVNRTTAFSDVLEKEFFGKTIITDQCRDNIDVVINASELRTGSAFRFGSRESGCWRFGTVVDNNITVAKAVAASAAYPALLPALDLKFDFRHRNNQEVQERVLLTDGGVFDNLGVTCLEPGRSAQYSTNVFQPEYIISCSAGPGLLSEDVYPYWWPSRMIRAFESVFRKAQDSAYERLHRHVESGKLNGFILAYLGQQDYRLPYIPPDLVRREEVFDYPTDFAPIAEMDIERIALRGEQLTRLLIAQYCPVL